ncbi:MAG: SpoIID/LytB domain-containing protein [Firmicutes bacterium]|nr:SpoIID/LytB domain-containing protein [Bacillota bacterium]
MRKKSYVRLLLFVLLLVIFFVYFLQAKSQIQSTVTHFFSLATTGNEQASTYLTPTLADQDDLLTALKTEGLFTLAQIENIRFSSHTRASVQVEVRIGDELKQINLVVVREAGKWLIQSIPAVTVAAHSLVASVTQGAVDLVHAPNHAPIRFSSDIAVTVGNVGFAVALDDTLLYFKPLATKKMTKLLTITGRLLEDETSGNHHLAADVSYFKREATGFNVVDGDSLIVGMEDLTLYVQDEQVQAVMLPEQYVPQQIRVVLNTTGFNGLSHQVATLTATTAYSLIDKVAGSQRRFNAGQMLTFTPNSRGIAITLPSGETQIFQNRLHLVPDGLGRVQMNTLRRGNPAFTPSYRGQLEVNAHNGSLILVNEVPLEAYLYSVVPSEMPISFGTVALQVQAVAARSYAVASIYRSGFRSYAAHVDDSISSQVYNNVPEYEASTAAVNHTAGVVVKYQGAIADTRFFSTSAGVTGNFEEIWHDQESGAFPGPPLPYLTSKSQLRTGQLPAVSTEAGAREFFASTNWDGFDKNSPWFRWQVEMSRSELEAILRRYLPERYSMQAAYVLTAEGNTFVSKALPEDPLGELQDLRVIRRGEGGNIMELELVGTNGTYRLLKEYTIRFTLRPIKVSSGSDVILARHDGSTLANYAILPSAYLVFDIKRNSQNAITSIRFQGGGNGHGAGMSQWGARGLAEDGRTFDDIVLHYYPDGTLERAY